MKSGEKNPLGTPQREVVGAGTFAKYDYQYHWALEEAVNKFKRRQDFVVFVEYHEDVIIADSVDVSKARFSFSQIKNTSKKYTVKSICKPDKINSVLGKLIQSCISKKFSHLVDKIFIRSTGGFGFTLSNLPVNKKEYLLKEIDSQEYSQVEKSIINELGIEKLPDNIYFETPDFPSIGFQDKVTGSISNMIVALHPGSMCNSTKIYQALIDDLHRKGQITHNYHDWLDAVTEKGLTSESVSKVVRQHTRLKDEQSYLANLNFVLDRLYPSDGNKAMQAKRSINKFRAQLSINPSSATIKIVEISKEVVSELIDKGVTLSEIVSTLPPKIPDLVKNPFLDESQCLGIVINAIATYDDE